jgi:hypothetical protein
MKRFKKNPFWSRVPLHFGLTIEESSSEASGGYFPHVGATSFCNDPTGFLENKLMRFASTTTPARDEPRGRSLLSSLPTGADGDVEEVRGLVVLRELGNLRDAPEQLAHALCSLEPVSDNHESANALRLQIELIPTHG